MAKRAIALFLALLPAAYAQTLPGVATPSACHSGDWITPATVGEGYNLNVLPNGNATFYFYTYTRLKHPTFYTAFLTQEENKCLTGELVYSFNGAMFSETNPTDVIREQTGVNVVICISAVATDQYRSDDWGLITFVSSSDGEPLFITNDFVRLTPRHKSLCD